MRLWPRSLAGRLAALLVLTLVIAQIVTFALFAGERVSAFRNAFREDLFVRFVSLARLMEETPPGLRGRIVATASSSLLRISLDAAPRVEQTRGPRAQALRDNLAAALGKPADAVRVSLWEHRRRWRDDRGERRRVHSWVSVSAEVGDGMWLNAASERPPVPPLGMWFMGSFLISAIAVATVGALGVRFASKPLRQLANAADRLGRGESFDPLPEAGPRETRQANIAFNRMRERLDRFIRDRTAMLAAVAHDLRTPITSLRLRAEFIEDEEARAKILETLAEMQTMAEAVLAFARGDAESEPSRPTDVTALVESIVEDAAASGRDVSFADSPQAVLACRPSALRRAISNLTDNATFYGKSVRVRVERAGEDVCIVVEDEGPGIPPADLERAFEPFVRLEGSRSRETGGAGLGLAIARGIFRAHGGDVRLENRAEGGLRAIATLPV
jgi:signal transduction histidine kinase